MKKCTLCASLTSSLALIFVHGWLCCIRYSACRNNQHIADVFGERWTLVIRHHVYARALHFKINSEQERAGTGIIRRRVRSEEINASHCASGILSIYNKAPWTHARGNVATSDRLLSYLWEFYPQNVKHRYWFIVISTVLAVYCLVCRHEYQCALSAVLFARDETRIFTSP
jgi:hypothetical protein